ncbi:lipoprotein insertase outer membrane protein LolB [Shewanella nanhaiensis]|uniref:Outer-membrane lipoprotein LolB n=1 Tax=Shewanella nanhaiensis TaxID=2864872 RepID=A0ABS7E8K9_9GAMM|nr:lipoprotein insertase outer membrane protein LolB [Shewanella nanhaiensis]MBW8186023.1 lipoprotein insertase outer membrane protein LolB [Shewanella nanhaiensis]
MNNLSYFTKTKLVWVILSLSLLSACATKTPDNLIPVQVNHVSQAQAWEMQGKLAVRTADDKFSTNLYWLHTADINELKLTTMLGTTLLSLTTEEGVAKLEVDGKVYRHHDAQELLTEITGWSIPVDALPLWITGQAAQGDKIISRDPKSRPTVLLSEKDSPPWKVEFNSWQEQSGAEIPRLLALTREQLRLKIQISQWQALSATTLATNNQKK